MVSYKDIESILIVDYINDNGYHTYIYQDGWMKCPIIGLSTNRRLAKMELAVKINLLNNRIKNEFRIKNKKNISEEVSAGSLHRRKISARVKPRRVSYEDKYY
jgi:hypothetical protein